MVKSLVLFAFILILFLSACTERVGIDLDEAGEPRLTVFAEITNDARAHEVKLTKSTPYFYNEEMPPVSNAIVQIDDGRKVLNLTEDKKRPGVYLTHNHYFGEVGRHYQLTIKNVDINDDGQLEEYTAQTEMKAASPVLSVAVRYSSRWDGWEVAVFSEDPGGTEDYYLFKVYKNGVLYTDSIFDYWTTDDKFFNGDYISGPLVQFFDEDKGEIVEKGDTIVLELAGITEAYFNFIEGVHREVGEKIPLFSGPAANIQGNISNGALGFFTAMEVSRGSVVYHGELAEQ